MEKLKLNRGRYCSRLIATKVMTLFALRRGRLQELGYHAYIDVIVDPSQFWPRFVGMLIANEIQDPLLIVYRMSALISR